MKFITFGITLVIAFLLALPSSHAQSIKKKAWIVLNDGDTLHGWINYRNWERNPSAISFSKDSLSEDFSKYSKHDLQSIYVDGLDYYQKVIVQKDTRPVKLPDLLPADVDLTVTDTALLRLLVDGSHYTLYELVDQKNHYFIKAGSNEIKELTYRVVSLENGSITTDKTYARQLKALLHERNGADLGNILKAINACSYKEKDLIRVVKEMNKLDGSIHYAAATASRKLTNSFFVGAGGGISTLKFSGSQNVFGKMKFGSAFTPFATVGIDIATARNLQALVLRGELSFSTASYKGSRPTYNPPTSYEVSQANISPSVALLYNFIRKESLKIYIGGGAAYNFSFYSKNLLTKTYSFSEPRQTDNYLDYPNGWLSLSLKLGVKINKKLEAGVNGQLVGTFTDYVSWGFSANTYTAQVRYFFR